MALLRDIMMNQTVDGFNAIDDAIDLGWELGNQWGIIDRGEEDAYQALIFVRGGVTKLIEWGLVDFNDSNPWITNTPVATETDADRVVFNRIAKSVWTVLNEKEDH